MQAQDYAAPFRHHPDLYHTVDTGPLLGNDMYRPVPDPPQYFAPDRLTLNHHGFSRGSSLVYSHQEPCRYFPDTRGPDAATPAASSGLVGSSVTGQTIAGETVAISGNSDFFREPEPEGIPDYQYEQQWQWDTTSELLHGVVTPAVQVASSSSNIAPAFATNKSTLDARAFGSAVLQPAAQLPTPASMAILLNHNNSRSDMRAPQAQQSAIEIGSGIDASVQTAVHPDIMLAQASAENPPSREKKHGCTMCHKRFDRPSTLRKHLLVHTGEKAFVCDTCGRRFGVMSNLNRHIRRCVLKPVHTTVALGNQSASANSPTSSSSSPPNAQSTDAQTNTDNSSSSNTLSANRPSRQTDTSPVSQARQPGQKRRRRAPSPSRWIPPSLLSFNLSPPEAQKATPVPLPPVKRNLHKGEERDSWDENVASSPYHPCGWKDVLPGPGFGLGLGLGGKDVRNLNLGGNGGFMLGRVLVF